jgi:hypothetical protein
MNKTTIRRLIGAFIITGSLIFSNSCLDPGWDFERVSDEIVLSPGIAAPLFYGSLGLGEMVERLDITGSIKEFDDGLLYLSYAQGLISFPANEIIDIPNQTFLEFFIDSDIALDPVWLGADINDTVSFQKNKDGVFVFENNERLDSIHVKTMDMVIDVRSSFKHTGILTITSENIIIDGAPFQDVVQISDPSGNFSYTRTIPVDGHTIYLDNTDPDTTVLPLRFDLDLINSGNPILPSESCDISMTFVDPEFYAVFGYIGDYNLISTSGNVEVDVFDVEEFTGNLFFAGPSFTLDIINSYGLPVEIDLYNVQAYSRINEISTDVVFEPGIVPFLIGAPDLENLGDTVLSQFEINSEDSNIGEVMETSPSEFSYSVSAEANPDGPGTHNFITDSSNLEVGFEVTLPIWIKANGWTLDRTVEFDFQEEFGAEPSEIIDYLRFTMDAVNYIPMQMNMQMYFADQDTVVLDSLFADDAFLLPPLLNAEDIVEEPSEFSKSAELTKEKLQRIEATKHLIVKASVNSAGADLDKYVKFYSYYTVDFKLKMKADMTINSRDF